MAKVYDLTAKITADRPIIKIGDTEFEVNDNYKTVVLVQGELGKMDSQETFDFVFDKLLGKEAVKKIDELKLNFASTKTLFIAVMAAACGEEMETVEARFQQATEQE